MELTFIGSGSAFNKIDGQSNMLLKHNGKTLLIDCGSTCWMFAEKLGIRPADIDAVYISHLHADHIGGLEELAFCTYFNPNAKRPLLFCNNQLMHELWEQGLRGGLESIQGKVAILTEYFDCRPVENSRGFEWEGLSFHPVQTVHVMSGYHIKYSYGLLFGETLGTTDRCFITADTQFAPHQIRQFYSSAKLIFQDCETSKFQSGVHAHFDELKTLDKGTKLKMFLYHYQPGTDRSIAVVEGFKGFAEAGACYDLAQIMKGI